MAPRKKQPKRPGGGPGGGPKRACGRMVARDDGVDLACVRDGRVHSLRLRFCLDSDRRVRLLGSGVFYGELTRAEVEGGRVRVTPPRHRALVSGCVRSAGPLLADALRAYVLRFDPEVRRLLDARGVAWLLRTKHAATA